MQEQIYEALRRGANDEALALARAAVDADANAARPQLWLAMALVALGRRDEALVAIDRAIALAPDDADLHFHRAGMLLGRRDLDAAQAALSEAVALDPNQFGAYIMQAQLALGRGELEEAERLNRLAARLAPEHPWCRVIEGMVALRRGEHDTALGVLSQASQQAPEDVQVLHALGFAYLGKGHFAFAEQAFRKVLDKSPQAVAVRALLSEVIQRQGRVDEALAVLQPLVDADDATAPLLRRAGLLALELGRDPLPWLRRALAMTPADPTTLELVMEAWRRNGDLDDARGTLEAALATAPRSGELWRARLSLERVDDDGADALLDRWLTAMPGHVPALEARMMRASVAGDADAAEAIAREILAIEPGRTSANRYLIDRLLLREPAQAVAHIEGLIAQARDDEGRRLLRHWLALAQDRAGDHAAAVANFTALNAEVAAQRLPLPEAALRPAAGWPPMAAKPEPEPATAFLYGPPGSRVEQLAVLLQGAVQAFRSDRFSPNPPSDLLQRYDTLTKLGAGELAPADVAASWHAQLPARGLSEQEAIDWLLVWDNVLLSVLRDQFPHASLVIALRDPRDMLLDWLVFGAPAPMRIESPHAAASWLAGTLAQVAQLHEEDLFPHSLVRLDGIEQDPAALVAALSDALRVALPEPPPQLLGVPRFEAGHWRKYAEALAGPFAILAPVAVRLGYPET